MAEIILPPEEEQEETPQAPELNIDKPTENSKVITIEFEAKKTNKVSTKDTNQQLYTTDTDAWFEFKETSLEGANGTYSVVFRNRHDGSVFQRTGDVVGGVAYYKIPHQEIRHAGAWRGQVVYTLSNGDTTAREFDYVVKGHILDGKDVREIVVEDFETLMSQLRSMKDSAEVELAHLTQELRNTTDTAEQNETDRQAFFDDLVEDIDELQTNYQELLDTGVLQTNINTKLEALEEEYAPKLTEVTTQLAHKASKTDVRELLANVSEGTPLFADKVADMTDTSRVYVNTSDGLLYAHDGTKFTSLGVQYQSSGLYVYSPNVISHIDGQATLTSASQIYSNNDRMVEDSFLSGIKVQIRTTEMGNYYFDLYVIEPNTRVVSKTRLNYSATVVGDETITISGLDINVPKGAIVATQTPAGSKSVIKYYPHSELGDIQAYSASGFEESKIAGKMAHELYVNVKTDIAEITTELEKNVLDMGKRLSVTESEVENLTKKDHILKGKTWSVVGDSISDNINYGRLTLYYEWISEMVGGIEIDMQAKAATGFIEESSSQGTENIMDRIPLLNPLSDYITVFAGTNDINRPLGTLGSTDVTTIYGSIDFVCKALIEKYPLKKIGFFTPIPRVGFTAPNNNLEKVARAIKEVCALYSIPVLDLYTESGLRPNNVTNKQTLFDHADGLHPSSLGHKWLVPRILDFMEKL